jgi:hypothetical protein
MVKPSVLTQELMVLLEITSLRLLDPLASGNGTCLPRELTIGGNAGCTVREYATSRKQDCAEQAPK